MCNTLKKPDVKDYTKYGILNTLKYELALIDYISILESNLYKLSKAHLALQIKYEELKQENEKELLESQLKEIERYANNKNTIEDDYDSGYNQALENLRDILLKIQIDK